MSTRRPTHVYVTYIIASAEQVWRALTEGELTRRYWANHRNVSDWKPGSPWRHEDFDDPSLVDIVGTVVESERPRRLVITWASPAEANDAAKRSRVTFDIVEDDGLVRLTVTHDELEPGSDMERGIDEGWPMVLANVKTLLETGRVLPDVMVRNPTGWTRLRFKRPA